jgi:hypothetical protein
MSQVLTIGDAKRGGPPLVRFDRSELSRILALYSRGVSEGEWRDYAIDQHPSEAVFSIFRHAFERPLFTIAKKKLAGHRDAWIVASGPRRLCRGDTLDDVLGFFERERGA